MQQNIKIVKMGIDNHHLLCLILVALPTIALSFTRPLTSSRLHEKRGHSTHRKPTNIYFFGGKSKQIENDVDERTYPESKPATYDLLPSGPFDFSPEAIVKPLLKQTQLQNRKLKVIYNAKKDGWDARKFHSKVDGKGASVVLAKVRGQWIGGYNPRGWASLGGSRPSVASFLFYKKGFSWQKLRVNRTGGMACGRDEYDQGIYFGSDSFVIPLNGQRPRSVASRLGYYFETGPGNRSTLLPVAGADATVDELYVISGVYAPGEDIPNSGGVTDLGLY
mmetsp:Transcript_21937/g.43865  ORF Transcript_21937/g.43865 Transcript_21937/m.43865 type:complete len:278 (-) Transcript_21937:1794-2627(-)